MLLTELMSSRLMTCVALLGVTACAVPVEGPVEGDDPSAAAADGEG
jgi:hypothetical protein